MRNTLYKEVPHSVFLGDTKEHKARRATRKEEIRGPYGPALEESLLRDTHSATPWKDYCTMGALSEFGRLKDRS